MRRFNWKQFWEVHPQQYFGTRNAVNVRPDYYDYQKAYKNVDKYLHFTKDDVVLDVGCGSGELTAIIKGHVSAVAGVDYSANMIRVLKSRYSFDTRIAPADNIPYKDETFTKIVSMGVIQHVPPEDFDKTILEMYRLLKPGGVMMVGDILEEAPESAAVFCYSTDDFKRGLPAKALITTGVSYFEKRLHVIVQKPGGGNV